MFQASLGYVVRNAVSENYQANKTTLKPDESRIRKRLAMFWSCVGEVINNIICLCRHHAGDSTGPCSVYFIGELSCASLIFTRKPVLEARMAPIIRPKHVYVESPPELMLLSPHQLYDREKQAVLSTVPLRKAQR